MMRAAVILSAVAMVVWPEAARSEDAIRPIGNGVLRICRSSWYLTGQPCRKYYRIQLPSSIRVGDAFRVEYGSNPKSFQFWVGRIDVKDGRCSIYGGGKASRDRIRVDCQVE